jgi:hypothetical protein
MKTLNNYRTFLVESKTISEDSEEYQEKISVDIKKIVNTFLKSKKTIDKSTLIYNFDNKKFPVKDLKVEIKLFKYKENVCNAVSYFNDSKIENEYLINPVINLEIFILILDEDFKENIDSVILHELLHCYQYYNQETNNKHQPYSWSIGTVISKLRKDIKTEYVTNVLDLLYSSLKHEISAQIHHYYFYKKRNKDYSKIFNIIHKLKEFKIKELSKDEIDEIELLKSKVFNFILDLKINKKYKKDLNHSLWKENNNIVFLEKLNDIFIKSSLYIEKKIKQVDSKIELNENDNYSSVPTAFDRKDYLDFYYYDPIIDLLKDIEELF